MSKKLTFAFSLALASNAPSQADPQPSWLDTHELKNGVIVHVLQVADATEQSAFTMLPIGLDSDPAGRAQFSHLAEHMMIRSTDPKNLTVGDIRLNGETTTSVLRLESLAPAADWRASLTRHARWLTARKFSKKVLAREKVRIESEEKATVRGHANHKWATVAWAQHMAGLEHIAIHGDVASATVKQIEDYVASRVKLSEARMFLSGPRPAKELIAALEAEFTKISRKNKKAAKPTAPKNSVPKAPKHVAGHRDLTWDLAAKHYIEWYALPEDCTRAEAMLLAQSLGQAFHTLALGAAKKVSRIGVAARHGDRNYLVLSSDFPEGSKLDDHQTEFAMVLDFAKFANQSANTGEDYARQIDTKPNFVALRKKAPRRVRSMIEANVSMQVGYSSMRLDVLPTAIPAALRSVTRKRLDALFAACKLEHRFAATITEGTKPK